MTDLWRMFIKERANIVFSDDWWKEIIDEILGYKENYKGTIYYEYVGEMGMTFLNQWERLQNVGQNRVSKKVLPKAQGRDQEELQRSDAVSEVDRGKENSEQLSASDW